MAKRCRARLNAGRSLDQGREVLADATEPRAAESVEAALVVGVVHGVERETLRHHDERCPTAIVGSGDPTENLLHRRLLFWNQDGVGAGCHAGMKRDPPDVPAHDLGNHAAAVRVAGGAQAVHRIRGDLHRGVKPEGVVGRRNVVVNSLRHADDLEPIIGEPLGRRQRAFAADGDDRLDLVALHDFANAHGPAVAFERVCARGAQDRAALLADALHLVTAERQDLFLSDPSPSVLKANELLTVKLFALQHGPADDRVEARCVSATGQNSDSHVVNLGGVLVGARPDRRLGGAL